MKSIVQIRELNDLEISAVSGGDVSQTPQTKAATSVKSDSYPPSVFEGYMRLLGYRL